MGEAGVIAIFCGMIRDGGRPTIFGDGTQTRDYIYVGDVVRAQLAAGAGVGHRRDQRRHRPGDVGARHRRGHEGARARGGRGLRARASPRRAWARSSAPASTSRVLARSWASRPRRRCGTGCARRSKRRLRTTPARRTPAARRLDVVDAAGGRRSASGVAGAALLGDDRGGAGGGGGHGDLGGLLARDPGDAGLEERARRPSRPCRRRSPHAASWSGDDGWRGWPCPLRYPACGHGKRRLRRSGMALRSQSAVWRTPSRTPIWAFQPSSRSAFSTLGQRRTTSTG